MRFSFRLSVFRQGTKQRAGQVSAGCLIFWPLVESRHLRLGALRPATARLTGPEEKIVMPCAVKRVLRPFASVLLAALLVAASSASGVSVTSAAPATGSERAITHTYLVTATDDTAGE